MKEVLLFSLLAFLFAMHSYYPKPVKDLHATFQIDKLQKGSYSVLLFNLLGHQVSQFQIEVSNENIPQTIQLPSFIKRGTYNLLITDGTLKLNRTCMVN